jgi:methionyl-tRNA synthetase
LEQSLRQLWGKTHAEFIPLCEGFQFHTALERVMEFLTEANAYVEKRAPFRLAKSAEAKDQALMRTSLATMAESLRLAVAIIQHVTPATAEKINAVLGYTPGATWRDELVWGTKLTGAKVAEALMQARRAPTAVGASAWEARAAVGRALCVLASLAIGRGEAKVGKQYADLGIEVRKPDRGPPCRLCLRPRGEWLTLLNV